MSSTRSDRGICGRVGAAYISAHTTRYYEGVGFVTVDRQSIGHRSYDAGASQR